MNSKKAVNELFRLVRIVTSDLQLLAISAMGMNTFPFQWITVNGIFQHLSNCALQGHDLISGGFPRASNENSSALKLFRNQIAVNYSEKSGATAVCKILLNDLQTIELLQFEAFVNIGR